jgi:hypothetical protein
MKLLMEFKLKPVNEQEAIRLLRGAARNRKLSHPRVEAFSVMILRDDWKQVPNPVCVLPNGQLGNGRHRMAGIALAFAKARERGTHLDPVPVWFCYGVPEDVVLEMDRGRAQSLADTEIMDGDDKAKKKTEVARVFLPVEGRPNSTLERGIYYDILEALGEDSISAVLKLPSHRGLTAPVRAAFVYARPIEPEIIDNMGCELAQSFKSGTANMNVTALRRVMDKKRQSPARVLLCSTWPFAPSKQRLQRSPVGALLFRTFDTDPMATLGQPNTENVSGFLWR